MNVSYTQYGVATAPDGLTEEYKVKFAFMNKVGFIREDETTIYSDSKAAHDLVRKFVSLNVGQYYKAMVITSVVHQGSTLTQRDTEHTTTEQELIRLSNEVANLTGRQPSRPEYVGEHPDVGSVYERLWLYQDTNACMELACDNNVGFVPYDTKLAIATYVDSEGGYHKQIVRLADHHNSRRQATCVAILQAVKELLQ